MQRISTVFWGILAILLFSGCGGGQTDEPRPTVDDPRATAVEALQTMDLNTWWQAYRNTDPNFVGQIVDEVADRQPDGLPTDAQRLDRLIRSQIVNAYKLRMADTDEGKAFILAQAEARFANPPLALWDANGKIALLDFYSLPGVWSTVTRLSDGLTDPPAIEIEPFVTPEVLANSLQTLVDAYPDAQVYQIRYQYHDGSDLTRVLMQFTPDSPIVYREDGTIVFTPEPVAWDDLLNGRINLADLEWDSPMEGVDAPPMTYPPDEPLPMK
jgi:hypothetical protein